MFFHRNCFEGFGGMGDYILKLNRLFLEAAADLLEAYKISHDLGTQLSLMISETMLGPLVVSPSHEALLPNVPPENVAAMADAVVG
jgi:hypothetical protein